MNGQRKPLKQEKFNMDATTVYNMRSQAMIDFEEGRLPQAGAKLDELISNIGLPETRQMKGELCQCLMDRATIHRFSNRWEEALADLSASRKLVPGLAPIIQRGMLANIYLLFAKIYANPYATIYDRETALTWLKELRKLGWVNWVVDELESAIAFRGREWDRAARLAMQAAEALASEGWERGVVSCRRRAGEAFFELGDFQRARIELTAAYDFFKKRGPPDELVATELALARLKSAHSEYDNAWELASKALDGAELLIRHFRALPAQQRFLSDKMQNYKQAFEIGLAKGGVDGWLRGWTVAERAKSFYLCQLLANADISLFADVDAGQIEKLKDLELRLDDCERTLARNEDGPRSHELAKNHELLSHERQELLFKMMQDNPRWAALRTPPHLDLNTVLEQLDPAFGLLSYFWQENGEDEGETLYIFYASGIREPQCVTIFWSKPELNQLDDCRNQLRGVVDPYTPIFPKELIAKVFPGKVLDAFKENQHLLVSPHGRLRGIPLHAIDIGQKDFVIDHWPIQYIPTLALLPLCRYEPHPGGVMLMGCPENAFQKEKLEEIDDEIETLYRLWSVKRPNRVKKSIIKVSESPQQVGLSIDTWQQFEFLHFACHGDFPEGRPFDAALRLGTDAIRTSELFTTRLRATLVTLSACSLGRQASRTSGVDVIGDEWVGLYLPLLYAGAENLLVSLWDANDQIAASFMKTLHKALSEGTRPAAAFQQAVRSVKRKPVPLWANWYLVGFPIRNN